MLAAAVVMKGGAEEQFNYTQIAAQAAQRMADSSQAVVQSAGAASAAASDAAGRAQEGRAVLHESAAALNNLSGEVTGAADAILQLGAETKQIATILDTIGAITEQTNLLALNAAIEAAHAGEQGRGFAIVAQQVRALSQQTGAATQEINALLHGFQQQVTVAVRAIGQGREQMCVTVAKTDLAVAALNDITAVVNRIDQLNGEIAQAAEQQRQVMNELNANVHSLSQLAKQNRQCAEHSQAHSQTLSRVAQQLQQLLDHFKVEPALSY
ncbi:hypothetical protein HUU62_11780 [Rhodoferax sp. 4810]|uniref:Methyl-accepting transducer domain-containing protein n=1 Tax=Thiospirillum jenense TaxID=1653858 RepID=A0A839HIK7_9GAMM|nr:methyl-accepting chemotaxis protein [Thiospirillum jenense]MBB1075089.1 hypothetical protein [Rhodoferax jenense]MBB1126738.1 hypothetical protein [Thiospirillum jenense]